MTPANNSRILQAVDALRTGDRDAAVALLDAELREGPASGARWKSVSKLAANIGEIEISLEAARRYAAASPPTLEGLLYHWGELTAAGRTEIALAELARLPGARRRHPSILHFEGTVAGQTGDFVRAEACYREAIAQTPQVPQTWFGLAMIKTFAPGDPDLEAMERLRPSMTRAADPSIVARFLYGLAKAWHDCGDHDRAFALYSEGAALRRREEHFDPAVLTSFADALIRDFTPDAIARLRPSGASERRVVFVNGLPRSGTTLVEQILASHSEIEDGAEINLFRAALIPTIDYSFAGAMRYQDRVASPDPWGDVGRAYFRMLEMRFRTRRCVIDKTLSQSHLMGLLLHTLPEARVIWMRRDPEDTALSCFRNYFTSAVPWSWSLDHIGHFFRIEDQLFEHWTRMFPDRILTVPYESLARDPAEWVPRILAHARLPEEPQVFRFYETKRSVRTASVAQVRAPITTGRIGLSGGYSKHLERFRAAYRG